MEFPSHSMPGYSSKVGGLLTDDADQRACGRDLTTGRRATKSQPTIFRRTAQPWGMRSVGKRFLRRTVLTAMDPKVRAFRGRQDRSSMQHFSAW